MRMEYVIYVINDINKIYNINEKETAFLLIKIDKNF